MIIAAITLTLIGPVVGVNDAQVYYNIPTDQGAVVERIEHNGTIASVQIGDVLCAGPLTNMACSDGGYAIVTLGEQHYIVTAGRGRDPRKFWRLNGGTVERP